MTEDPFESEEYQKFIDSMTEFCFCEYDRPCEGVLAGGLCDRKMDSFDDLDNDLGEDEYDNGERL